MDDFGSFRPRSWVSMGCDAGITRTDRLLINKMKMLENGMDDLEHLLSDTHTVDVRNLNKRCVHCEAIHYTRRLKYPYRGEMGVEQIRQALVFVLENTDWPVLDNHHD